MAFRDFPQQAQGILLLQRSLERGRLAHAYLFSGHQLDQLEPIARTLAKALNCQKPLRKGGVAMDCCDQCASCRKIDHGNHPDVHWVRPESKSRIVTVEQIRDLMHDIQLKPTEAEFKVATILGADRLRVEAANAFLKTLEEPPAKSILILLTTDPQRILETITSRCLRLNFAGEAQPRPAAPQLAWLRAFSDMAATPQKSLLSRYRLLDTLLRTLNQTRETIDTELTARSPLQRYPEAEKEWQEKWEDELKAAVEAEYRRQRSDWLGLLQNWLRDVWLQTLQTEAARAKGGETSAAGNHNPELLNFPELAGSAQVARRISSKEALQNVQVMEQLQGWLGTNVQEALALEVGLLKLRL
jgi:DNA polymerase III subunit delta'